MSLLRRLRVTPVIAKSKVAASAGVVGIIATALNRRDDDAALDSASIESLMLSGDLGAALASVDRMLSDPDNQKAHLLCIRGSILRRWGRLSEAASTYAHAVNVANGSARANAELANVLMETGDAEGALASARSALVIDPDSVTALFALARALQARGNDREAVAELLQCIRRDPNHADAWITLGTLVTEGDCEFTSEDCFRRAISVEPSNASAWVNLGVELSNQGREDQSTAALSHAYALEASGNAHVGAYEQYGMHLLSMGRTNDALALLRREVARNPSADGHLAISIALQRTGDWPRAWAHHEFRWLTNLMLPRRPQLGVPAWTGQPLQGKTIALCDEQGVGDLMQYLRYAPMVRDLGASVSLCLRKPFDAAFMRGFDGIDRVVQPGESMPRVDFQCSMMSLPYVFGTDLESVPCEVPYFKSDATRGARWRQRIPDEPLLRVGIVWAGNPMHGNDRNRSLRLAQLQPLLSVPGVNFYSLQKQQATTQAEESPAASGLTDLGHELNDFSDTAAAISQLDLVISVDTAVAHLAGALGRPVWLMLPEPSDARWLESRPDTPWYPGLRLFRQIDRGEWSPVVQRVASELELAAKDPVAFRLRANASMDEHATTRRHPTKPHAMRPAPAEFSGLADTRAGIVHYFPDQPIAGKQIGSYGELLRSHVELISRQLPKGASVVEVDSGVGLHALAIGAHVGRQGTVLCYEDRAPLRRLLRQNLDANGLRHVDVVKRRLRRSSAPAWKADTPPVPERIEPPSNSSDDTIDGLRLETLHLLKLNDSAGVEDIVAGAADTLWRLRPRVFVHGGEHWDAAPVAARLRDFGYRVWRVETSLHDPGNFNRCAENLFEQRTTVALIACPEELGADALLAPYPEMT